MRTRFVFVLLFSLAFASASHGEDVESRLKALEERSAVQDLSRQVGGGRLRLLDLSMDALFGAGTSTEDDESLQTLQVGGHDPRKRGFTVQNIELSLMGAVDPYLTGEAHLVFFLDPLSRETQVELEEAPISW